MNLSRPAAPTSRTRRALCLAAGLALTLLAGWGLSYWLISDESLLRQAEQSVQQQQFWRAERFCQQLLQRHPDQVRALELAAESAQQTERLDVALAYLQRIREPLEALPLELLVKRADLEFNLGRVRDAENSFRRVLARDPRHRNSLEKLFFLLRIEGRNWEAQAPALALLENATPSTELYYVLGTSDWIWVDPRETQFLAFCQQALPDDPLPALSQLRQALLRGEYESAAAQIERLAAVHPELIEVQSVLGTLRWLQGNDARFLGWQRSLPEAADDHPEIWYLRGIWLSQHGADRAAVRCLTEAICRHPNHRGATYQLSQLLTRLGQPAVAEQFGQRAGHLARIEYLLREAQHSPEFIRELAESLEKLGRWWEAVGWARMALQQDAGRTWAAELLDRRAAALQPGSPLTSGGDSLCASMHRADFPLPDWSRFQDPASNIESPRTDTAPSSIAFREEALQSGIEFRYDNGADPDIGRAYMFEFSGGGVAAFDYDGDGWCDVHLTQAGRWKSETNRAADKLFRNVQGTRFQDLTREAGLNEVGFSQGLTVGDYDNDGFQDLYIANIGPNTFYHNNGDGTFTEVTSLTDTAGNAWSLSAALADLNGDGLPDLYVANYLSGPDVFTRACQSGGRPIQCYPTSFPAEQDRLYLNLGDGRFQDLTGESGIQLSDGKGMGLIVADFDDDRRPDIFVANDTTPNFLFHAVHGPGEAPRFTDQGMLYGVAVDERGQAQSSMGAAVGDINGDGQLDLFVTNYILENSNLYVQQSDHSFSDQVARSGLREPCWKLLKWGTQLIDPDLDGDLDLVIANGHLNDFSDQGVPYTMPTQLFRNNGTGRFTEILPEEAGPYFRTLVLGRAVARCDWNRDGRDDLLVTHVDAPVALLTNQTQAPTHALRLQLRGITASRDAVGTTIRVHTGGRTLVRQLTAGDGFEAVNERTMIIGLASAEKADKVTIVWPTGETQTLTDLPADNLWLVQQGIATPWRMD